MNKGFAAPLVLLAVGLIIGVAGAVSFSQLKPKPSPISQSQTTQTSPAPTPAPTDETTNWKTYTNTQYRWTIKYPPEMKFEENPPGGNPPGIYLFLFGPTQVDGTELYDGISLSILSDFLGNKTLKQVLDEDINKVTQYAVLQEEPKSISLGKAAEGYQYRLYFERGGQVTTTHFLSGKNGQFVHIVDGNIDPTNKGFANIADQILSTFKFIN